MDTVSSQPGEMLLPEDSDVDAGDHPSRSLAELYELAQAKLCGLDSDQFAAILAAVGTRLNYAQPAGVPASEPQQAAFLRALRLDDLALAQACALGIESAWEPGRRRSRAFPSSARSVSTR